MEKSNEDIKIAVLGYCDQFLVKKGRHYIHEGVSVEVEVGGFVFVMTTQHRRSHLCEVGRSLPASDPNWRVAYSVSGLEARDKADETMDGERRRGMVLVKALEAVVNANTEIDGQGYEDLLNEQHESARQALDAYKRADKPYWQYPAPPITHSRHNTGISGHAMGYVFDIHPDPVNKGQVMLAWNGRWHSNHDSYEQALAKAKEVWDSIWHQSMLAAERQLSAPSPTAMLENEEWWQRFMPRLKQIGTNRMQAFMVALEKGVQNQTGSIREKELVEVLRNIDNEVHRIQKGISEYYREPYTLKTNDELIEKVHGYGFGMLDFHTIDIERLVNQSIIARKALEDYEKGGAV